MSETSFSELLKINPARLEREVFQNYSENRVLIPRSNEIYPKDNFYRAEPPKGTVELLSPTDEVLMRDGEVIEKRVEIKTNKFYMVIEDL